MCRNITTLRGLEPEASREEIEAAALQYVRKIGGVQAPSRNTSLALEKAMLRIADATEDLLRELPPRQRAPKSLPPLRRISVKARNSI